MPTRPSRSPLARLLARLLIAALLGTLLPAPAQASLSHAGAPSALPADLPLTAQPAQLALLVVAAEGAPVCLVVFGVADPHLPSKYHRARWMDPSVGRFASEDPWRGSPFEPPTLHRYLYVGDDPGNRVDPTGKMGEFSVGGMLAAMAIGAAVFGSITYIRTGHFGAAADSALRGALVGATFYAALPYAAAALWRISLLAGGGAAAAGGGSGGTVILYRAMSEGEFQQLIRSGQFQAAANSLEGKWLAETLPNAIQWGQRLEGASFRVVEVQVQATAAQGFFRMAMLDGIGPARYAELTQINGFIVGLRGVYP